ncbi:hypothetical protein [Sinisalibacter aestuarii]|uniref:hypothetical protein n=1 Tax=Sinisalibacter aestuarii TaxID=2949426 RepID=UPI002492C596|nr:hypothetical protein [Sinisalibacter aestuarii]
MSDTQSSGSGAVSRADNPFRDKAKLPPAQPERANLPPDVAACRHFLRNPWQ